MKRKTAALLALILTLAAALAAAQEAPATVTFGGSGYEIMRDVLILSNGNTLIVGDTRLDGKGEKLSDRESLGWIFCLDPSGKLLWERRDGEKNRYNIYMDPMELENGNLAVVMRDYVKDQLEGQRYAILEIAKDGAFVRRTELAEYPISICACQKGYFAVTKNAAGERYYSLLDAGGSAVWRIPRGDLPREALSVISLSKGLLIWGNKSVTENYAAAALLDDKGTPVWTHTFSSGEASWFSKGIKTKDGNLLLLGRDYILQDGVKTGRVLAVCYTQDGKPVWEQNYGEIPKLGILEDLISYGDGYLAVGVSHSNSRLKVLMLSAQGELKDQWIVRAEDTVYQAPAFCLLSGEPWVCANITRDDQTAIELIKAIPNP